MKVYIVFEYYNENADYENHHYERIVCIYDSKEKAQKHLLDFFNECLKENNKYGAQIYYVSCEGANIQKTIMEENKIEAELLCDDVVGVYIEEHDVF